MITGKSYIGYKLSTNVDVTYRTFNSSEGRENEWTIYEVTEKELDEAVLLAYSVKDEFAKTTYANRADFLRRIALNLENNRDELTRVYCLEASLPLERANSELDRTILQLNLFSDYIASGAYPEIVRHNGVNDLRKTYFPIGPVAVFGSSNFPFAYSTIGGDSASALASGCPVIIKSHPMHAGTGELVAKQVVEAAQFAGMPEGVFSNLNIRSHELGGALVKHELIKGVGFTGSLKGGRALFDIAQHRATPIPFFAEMGSLNPVCIHPSALRDKDVINSWVEKYAASISDGAGQFCTKPGLIFSIKGSSLDDFKRLLAKELSRRGSHAMLHPNLFYGFMNGVGQTDKDEHVSRVSGELSASESSVDSLLFSCKGSYFMQNQDLQHELFGPASVIVECDDMDQLNSVVSTLSGQLTGTILFGDGVFGEIQPLFELIKDRVGRVIFNGVPTGVEVCEAMNHGGPYPATTDSRFTAVGTNSIRRWLRPVVFQNVPEELLPPELH